MVCHNTAQENAIVGQKNSSKVDNYIQTNQMQSKSQIGNMENTEINLKNRKNPKGSIQNSKRELELQ